MFHVKCFEPHTSIIIETEGFGALEMHYYYTFCVCSSHCSHTVTVLAIPCCIEIYIMWRKAQLLKYIGLPIPPFLKSNFTLVRLLVKWSL